MRFMSTEKKDNIIIIGNSSISRFNFGTQIDKFGKIVRLNRFQTHEFEKDIGKKTTDWVVHKNLFEIINKSKDNFTLMQKKYPDLKTIKVIQYNKDNKESQLATNNYFSFNKKTKFPKLSKVSTGLMSIFYYLDYFDTVHLFNFDFGKTNHYFGSKDWGTYRKDQIKTIYPNNNHDWDLEEKIIQKLINQNKVTFLK